MLMPVFELPSAAAGSPPSASHDQSSLAARLAIPQAAPDTILRNDSWQRLLAALSGASSSTASLCGQVSPAGRARAGHNPPHIFLVPLMLGPQMAGAMLLALPGEAAAAPGPGPGPPPLLHALLTQPGALEELGACVAECCLGPVLPAVSQVCSSAALLSSCSSVHLLSTALTAALAGPLSSELFVDFGVRLALLPHKDAARGILVDDAVPAHRSTRNLPSLHTMQSISLALNSTGGVPKPARDGDGGLAYAARELLLPSGSLGAAAAAGVIGNSLSSVPARVAPSTKAAAGFRSGTQFMQDEDFFAALPTVHPPAVAGAKHASSQPKGGGGPASQALRRSQIAARSYNELGVRSAGGAGWAPEAASPREGAGAKAAGRGPGQATLITLQATLAARLLAQASGGGANTIRSTAAAVAADAAGGNALLRSLFESSGAVASPTATPTKLNHASPTSSASTLKLAGAVVASVPTFLQDPSQPSDDVMAILRRGASLTPAAANGPGLAPSACVIALAGCWPASTCPGQAGPLGPGQDLLLLASSATDGHRFSPDWDPHGDGSPPPAFAVYLVSNTPLPKLLLAAARDRAAGLLEVLLPAAVQSLCGPAADEWTYLRALASGSAAGAGQLPSGVVVSLSPGPGPGVFGGHGLPSFLVASAPIISPGAPVVGSAGRERAPGIRDGEQGFNRSGSSLGPKRAEVELEGGRSAADCPGTPPAKAAPCIPAQPSSSSHAAMLSRATAASPFTTASNMRSSRLGAMESWDTPAPAGTALPIPSGSLNLAGLPAATAARFATPPPGGPSSGLGNSSHARPPPLQDSLEETFLSISGYKSLQEGFASTGGSCMLPGGGHLASPAAAAAATAWALASHTGPDEGDEAEEARQAQMGLMVSTFQTELNRARLGTVPPGGAHAEDDVRALRVQKAVGTGSCSVVLLATLHAMRVAVKVIMPPDGEEAQALGGSDKTLATAAALSRQRRMQEMMRGVRELAVMTSISHPNIVQVYSYCTRVLVPELPKLEADIPRLIVVPEAETAPGPLCTVLIMEYCDMGSLADAIDTGLFAKASKMAAAALVRDHRSVSGDVVGPAARIAGGTSGGGASGPVKGVANSTMQGNAMSTSGALGSSCRPASRMLDLVLAAPVAAAAAGSASMRAVYLTLLEVALALRHLHSMGLVHCDVKPANVLLRSSATDPRGFTAKLTDFGFVNLLEQDSGEHPIMEDGGGAGEHEQPRQDVSGKPRLRFPDRLGTVTHMAPELFLEGSSLDSSIDVYAFGIVMWELYTGLAPYAEHAASGFQDVPYKVVRDGLRPRFPTDAPLSFKALAQECWATGPPQRPTAAALVTRLQLLMDQACGVHGSAASRAAAGMGRTPSLNRLTAA
ncbi:hypothetical protein HYH03_007634 [Edaphochlamys debaryana]|uniref:Protein kinase domain-containing protein n=1 Tax=Edaphochlamys debaryana TaxID=47281 RepID=A0A835Y1N1_9CHLO|nr:hypothetical protein HYH03_007634 [Edaphochlamys debaryana]|eukprot:KAG2494281.1 hypothetical protein HYH03_007634 [Edaphochlamys debaryana]